MGSFYFFQKLIMFFCNEPIIMHYQGYLPKRATKTSLTLFESYMKLSVEPKIKQL